MPERKPFGEFLFETLQAAAQAGLDITQQAQNTRQEKQLLALNLALKERTHREGIRQFNENVKLKTKELREKASQFDITAGLEKEKIDISRQKITSEKAGDKTDAIRKFVDGIRKDPNIKAVIESQIKQEIIKREDAELPPMTAQQELNLRRDLLDGAVASRLTDDVAGGILSLEDIRSIGRLGLVDKGDIGDILQAFAPPRTDTQGLIGTGQIQGPPAPPPQQGTVGQIFEKILPEASAIGSSFNLNRFLFGPTEEEKAKRGPSEVEKLITSLKRRKVTKEQQELLQNVQQTGLSFQTPFNFLNQQGQ